MSRRMSAVGILATALCLSIVIAVLGDDGSTQSPKPAGKKPEDAAAQRAAARQLIAAAISDAALISDARDRAEAFRKIAESQLRTGDITGAKATVSKISGDKDEEASAVDALLRAQVEAEIAGGNVARAKAIAAEAREPMTQAAVYLWIGHSQTAHGDLAGARNSLRVAKAAASKIANGEAQVNYYRMIAIALAVAGDVTEAKATAAAAGDSGYAVWAYLGIAIAQAKAKDTTGASETLRTARTTVVRSNGECFEYSKSEYLSHIAAAQARIGDFQGAKATAAITPRKAAIFRQIVDAQTKAGDNKAPRPRLSRSLTVATRVGRWRKLSISRLPRGT